MSTFKNAIASTFRIFILKYSTKSALEIITDDFGTFGTF